MYNIRKATHDDAEAIRDIAEQSWLKGHSNSRELQNAIQTVEQVYSVEEIRSLLADSVQYFLLVNEGLQPVGFISWSVEPSAFIIHQIYCLPSTQGKGYVSALMNELADIAAEEGITTVDLKLRTLNVNIKYYQSLGFELVPDEPIPFGSSAPVEFLLRKYVP